MSQAWTIAGSGGEPILGDAHVPDSPIGVALIVHGFLGYKDYGMFPRLTQTLCDAGFIAHRFNLSHSGMTNNTEMFERPDLFERDTWNKQVFDINAVIDAVRSGRIAGAGLPIVLIGHSRGGVSCLLCAGRRGRAGDPVAGVMSIAAPSATCMWDDATREEVLRRGYAEVTSNRTKQTLRIDAAWLREQIDDPGAHDVCAHARDTGCPVRVVHGGADPTVPASHADEIARAAGVEPFVVANANHVFNTPNPTPENAEPSAELAVLLDETVRFCGTCCAG